MLKLGIEVDGYDIFYDLINLFIHMIDIRVRVCATFSCTYTYVYLFIFVCVYVFFKIYTIQQFLQFFLQFQSHQIFHILVIAAAFVHYHGISEMAMYRLTHGDCTAENLAAIEAQDIL